MATEPVGDGTASSVRPSGPAELRRLRAERDALEARALEAERRAEALAGELAELRAEQAVDPDRLSLFDDLPPDDTPGRTEGGSDPAVVTLTADAGRIRSAAYRNWAAFRELTLESGDITDVASFPESTWQP